MSRPSAVLYETMGIKIVAAADGVGFITTGTWSRIDFTAARIVATNILKWLNEETP